MAPVQKKTIQHFTHQNHPLAEVYSDREYLCDGCKTLGIGMRYRCDRCDFDLHEHCGTCPTSFSSFMHPQHQLSLVIRKPQGTRHNERLCDVCGDDVEGLFYRCKLCEFDVHPLCTQLPQFIRHAMHSDHPLRLQPASASWCMVCKGVCTFWRYRCGVCRVDIHPECVLAPCDALSSPPLGNLRFPSPPSLPPRAPAYGAYAYDVPSSSSVYNLYHNGDQAQKGGSINGRKANKMMYKVVGKLALGVLTHAVFGMPDFSSFM